MLATLAVDLYTVRAVYALLNENGDKFDAFLPAVPDHTFTGSSADQQGSDFGVSHLKTKSDGVSIPCIYIGAIV